MTDDELCPRCWLRYDGYYPEWTCYCRPLTDVRKCARCGNDHVGIDGVDFQKLTNPPEGFTHFAMCPTRDEPILMYIDGCTEG